MREARWCERGGEFALSCLVLPLLAVSCLVLPCLASAGQRECRRTCRCRGPGDFALVDMFLRCRSRLVLILVCIGVEVSYPRGRVNGAEIRRAWWM